MLLFGRLKKRLNSELEFAAWAIAMLFDNYKYPPLRRFSCCFEFAREFDFRQQEEFACAVIRANQSLRRQKAGGNDIRIASNELEMLIQNKSFTVTVLSEDITGNFVAYSDETRVQRTQTNITISTSTVGLHTSMNRCDFAIGIGAAIESFNLRKRSGMGRKSVLYKFSRLWRCSIGISESNSL